MAAGWFSGWGRWLLGRYGSSGIVLDLRPAVTLWSRELGRVRWAKESGRTLMALESEWVGTFELPTGGLAGGRRRFGVYFANMDEIAVDGETLTGVPTVSVSPSGPLITAPAVNAAPMTLRINGQTYVAAIGTVVSFTVAAGTAPPGDYTLAIHADTSGGYILEPTATLTLE